MTTVQRSAPAAVLTRAAPAPRGRSAGWERQQAEGREEQHELEAEDDDGDGEQLDGGAHLAVDPPRGGEQDEVGGEGVRQRARAVEEPVELRAREQHQRVGGVAAVLAPRGAEDGDEARARDAAEDGADRVLRGELVLAEHLEQRRERRREERQEERPNERPRDHAREVVVVVQRQPAAVVEDVVGGLEGEALLDLGERAHGDVREREKERRRLPRADHRVPRQARP